MKKDISKEDKGFVYWHGVPTFLNTPYQPDMKEVDIGLIGFPYAGGNFVERTQYLGPRSVRSLSMGYHRLLREFSFNPFEKARMKDLGDVPLENVLNPDLAVLSQIAYFSKVHEAGIIPVVVGGDHSITYPILKGIAGKNSKHKGPVGMIHFDAHTDSYGALQGTAYHAGNPFRLALEEGLIDPARTVQIGIRGAMGDFSQDEFSEKNFHIIYFDEIVEKGIDWTIQKIQKIIGTGPTYVSFDLDVLDATYDPMAFDINGLTTREFFKIILGLRHRNVIGADVVCYMPHMDTPGQITNVVICNYLLYMCSLIVESKFLS